MLPHSRLHPVIARALESAAGAVPYHSLPIEEARATAKKLIEELRILYTWAEFKT